MRRRCHVRQVVTDKSNIPFKRNYDKRTTCSEINNSKREKFLPEKKITKKYFILISRAV